MKKRKDIRFFILPFVIFHFLIQMGIGQDYAELPPGQRETENFPILRIGEIPDLDRESWSLKIHGEVKNSIQLDWDSFSQLDTVHIHTPFHCVTGWSRMNNAWVGVRIQTILNLAEPKQKAKFISFKGADGYQTSLSISECLGVHDILGFQWEGQDLDNAKGGPVRAVIPGKYGFKSAMWLVEIKLTKKQELGYWEKRGYSNSANPWKEERESE